MFTFWIELFEQLKVTKESKTITYWIIMSKTVWSTSDNWNSKWISDIWNKDHHRIQWKDKLINNNNNIITVSCHLMG